jgi:hypothetical protein
MKYTAFALSLFSFFIILQSTSCIHGNKYPKETQMLDSMQTFVVKADSAVKKIDSAKIANYAQNIMKDDQLIQLLHGDNMSEGAVSIFRDFNAVRWSLLTIAGKRGPLLMELEKSQKQLKRLNHDLQHDCVAADSVGYYVAFETKKASELMQVADMSVNEVNRQILRYTELNPKADSLIALLKDHKKF